MCFPIDFLLKLSVTMVLLDPNFENEQCKRLSTAFAENASIDFADAVGNSIENMSPSINENRAVIAAMHRSTK